MHPRARFLCVTGEGLVGLEVPITLDGKAELAAYCGEFDEAYIAEFGLAHAEIAESEGGTVVGIELGQEPRALGVGCEEFDDGLKSSASSPLSIAAR